MLPTFIKLNLCKFLRLVYESYILVWIFDWRLNVLVIATFRNKKGLVLVRTWKIVVFDFLLLLDLKKLGRGSLAGCILHAKYITLASWNMIGTTFPK